MTVLIIGLGSIAKKHIQVLKELYPQVTIYALRSALGRTGMEGVNDVYKVSEVPEKLDFAIISNATGSHLEALEICLPLNIPVMIEKPITSSLKEPKLAACVSAFEKKGIVNYVACNLRFHPVVKFLKQNISTKRINEVNVYCGSYLPAWRTGTDFRQSYSVDPQNGGGVHLDLIHEIDYCWWLFGQPERTVSISSNNSTLSIQSCDFAFYNLKYKTFPVNITLNYYRTDSKRQIEILFEETTWTADLINCSIKDHRGEVVFSDPKFAMMDTYRDQMKYFISHMSSGDLPMNTLTEATEVLKICLTNE